MFRRPSVAMVFVLFLFVSSNFLRPSSDTKSWNCRCIHRGGGDSATFKEMYVGLTFPLRRKTGIKIQNVKCGNIFWKFVKLSEVSEVSWKFVSSFAWHFRHWIAFRGGANLPANAKPMQVSAFFKDCGRILAHPVPGLRMSSIVFILHGRIHLVFIPYVRIMQSSSFGGCLWGVFRANKIFIFVKFYLQDLWPDEISMLSLTIWYCVLFLNSMFS